MKKIELDCQESGGKKFIELFNFILEHGNYNLNQLVNGNALSISDEMTEEFTDKLKELLDVIPSEIRTVEKKESFWAIFEKLDDYEKNSKFIEWLKRYTDTTLRPFEAADFIREADEKTFQEMTDFCFQNLILKDTGRKKIENSFWNVKQMLILRKVIFTFIEMVVIDNLSKENSIADMTEMFGIKEDFCEKWWEYIEVNEEKLWRIMVTKKFSQIENKLDRILEAIED